MWGEEEKKSWKHKSFLKSIVTNRLTNVKFCMSKNQARQHSRICYDIRDDWWLHLCYGNSCIKVQLFTIYTCHQTKVICVIVCCNDAMAINWGEYMWAKCFKMAVLPVVICWIGCTLIYVFVQSNEQE